MNYAIKCNSREELIKINKLLDSKGYKPFSTIKDNSKVMVFSKDELGIWQYPDIKYVKRKSHHKNILVLRYGRDCLEKMIKLLPDYND